MLRCGRHLICQKCYSEGSSRHFIKKLHTSQLLMIRENSVKEIEIPTAWGHMSGKWWGNSSVQPVLAIHGVQDNAATFDTLVPLLDVDAVLAVDLPGHGWSSHIPIGFPYNYMDAVYIIQFLIKHHFKWSEPMVLLGHSFGSNLSFVYSAVYPKQVSKFISIDCSRHQMCDFPTTLVSSMRNTIEKLLRIEEKLKPPEYSDDELFEYFYRGRRGPEGWITKEACKTLLTRGTRRLPNGKVYLSRDPRLRLNAFGRLSFDTLLKLAPKITCDMLSIQAENGVVRNDFKGDVYKKTVEIILKNSIKSKHVILPGYHHVHLENPEIVANEINTFLSS